MITCAAAISRSSIAFPKQMSLGDDTFMPGLSALAARLRRHAALSVVQLCHGGARAIPSLTGVPAHSASGYNLPIAGFVPPLELSAAQIEQIIEDFACAAERAARAGFGGVEFHGANGYLFTQFLSTMTNRRSDMWGGSLQNRARLSREVVRASRRRVPASFVLGFRMSFESGGLETGLDLDECAEVMDWLGEDGIDYGHVSHLDFAAPSVKDPRQPALKLIRARVDRTLPLMCAGGITSRDAAERAMEFGADLVGVGRAAIGNSNVPAKLTRREALRHTPFLAVDLAELCISPDFIRYLQTAMPISTLNIVSR